jgi:hypothetical protein
MRRVLAIGSAALLAFTVTATTAPAADLGMPLKAPPITEAPPAEVDWLPLAVGLLVATGVGLCIALCEEHHGPTAPVTTGGNTPSALPSS